jgi:ABC-type sugar transport system substrate-binding protein
MKAAGIDLPDDIIFWYDGGGETLKSKNIMADFLTAHPDAHKILVGANTGNVAQGMLAAVQTAGRENDVMIYSYGAEQVALDNFHGTPNCWVADVGYYFRQYGWLGVNTAIRVLNGEEVGYWVSPENFVINYENVDSYLG